MAKEIDIDSVLLISLVEGNPVIWDKTLETYKTRVITKNAWSEILPVLIPGFESLDERKKQSLMKVVIQKWTHIRDNHFRSIRKIQEQKIAKRQKVAKPYLYSKRLCFLQKVMNPNLFLEDDSTSQDSIEFDDTNVITTDEPQVKRADTPKLAIKSTLVSSQAVPMQIPKRPHGKDISPIDAKMMQFMESFTTAQGSQPINRHISFFTGILPTLDNFDEDEVLEFQVGVLKLMKNIKKNRLNYDYVNSPSSCRGFSNSLNINPIKIEETE